MYWAMYVLSRYNMIHWLVDTFTMLWGKLSWWEKVVRFEQAWKACNLVNDHVISLKDWIEYWRFYKQNDIDVNQAVCVFLVKVFYKLFFKVKFMDDKSSTNKDDSHGGPEVELKPVCVCFLFFFNTFNILTKNFE